MVSPVLHGNGLTYFVANPSYLQMISTQSLDAMHDCFTLHWEQYPCHRAHMEPILDPYSPWGPCRVPYEYHWMSMEMLAGIGPTVLLYPSEHAHKHLKRPNCFGLCKGPHMDTLARLVPMLPLLLLLFQPVFTWTFCVSRYTALLIG